MRFFEFQGDDANIDKFINSLRNFVGRASSKKTPATMNWNAVAQLGKDTGFQMGSDYETFKQMYNQYPIIQSLVSDFDENGITLKVPGAPSQNDAEQVPQHGQETSQDIVGRIADANAEKQLSKSQTGIKL